VSDRVRLLLIGYRKFSELINVVMPEFEGEIDITIVESVASDSADYRTLIRRHRPDVVASAGSNAAYLQSTLEVPVVGQPVSPVDIMEALAKARLLARRVHLFAYDDGSGDLARLLGSLEKLADVEIVPVTYTTSDEARQSITLALADDGPEVVVGPSYTCHLAEQASVPAILIYSRSSARALLREAIEVGRAAVARPRPAREAPRETFVIRSTQLERVAELARSYARGSGPVLLHGESGTGKEPIAREIHRHSDFAKGPLVAVNCGSIPNELFESELFGYVEGAFTSSRRGGRVGLIEQANGGALFLDEVAEMPGPQQVKLLRVLQERRIRPVGSNREIPIEFKVIAATNTDLHEAVQRGTFRDDLFYRLNVLSLRLPPLRERPEDILAIAHYYLDRYINAYRVVLEPQHVLDRLAEHLCRYRWPGNVRELQNFMERVVVNCTEGSRLERLEDDIEDILPELFRAASPPAGGLLKEQEEVAIRDAMERFRGDRQKVAEFLGISSTTLWRRLRSMNGVEAAAAGRG